MERALALALSPFMTFCSRSPSRLLEVASYDLMLRKDPRRLSADSHFLGTIQWLVVALLQTLLPYLHAARAQIPLLTGCRYFLLGELLLGPCGSFLAWSENVQR